MNINTYNTNFDAYQNKISYLNIRKGSTVKLNSHIYNGGLSANLAGYGLSVYYNAPQVTSAWYMLTGEVQGNVASFTFDGTKDVGLDNYRFYARLQKDGDVNYTCVYEARMLPSPNFTPSKLDPIPQVIDFNLYTVLNAPWVSTSALNEHTSNTGIHTTPEQKQAWDIVNNAVQTTSGNWNSAYQFSQSAPDVYETKEDSSEKYFNACVRMDGKDRLLSSTVSSNYETKSDATNKLNEAKSYTDSKTSSISSTYETKSDATNKLNESKTYTDSRVSNYLPLSGGNVYGDSKFTYKFSQADGYAIGDFSHAEGSMTSAIGEYSHAEGCETIASGFCSHAEGYETIASGFCSHTDGENCIAEYDCQYVWCGDESLETPYNPQTGPGTFNINPVGNMAGFYIGNTSLQQHINGFFGEYDCELSGCQLSVTSLNSQYGVRADQLTGTTSATVSVIIDTSLLQESESEGSNIINSQINTQIAVENNLSSATQIDFKFFINYYGDLIEVNEANGYATIDLDTDIKPINGVMYYAFQLIANVQHGYGALFKNLYLANETKWFGNN